MTSKKTIWVFFVLMVLAQMYVPASMIWTSEDVLETGKAFKFKTAPVDPNDPFRGKYIRLRYDIDRIEIPETHDWTDGEPLFVSLNEDPEGFAQIAAISKKETENTTDFVSAKVDFITSYEKTELVIEYPFERFYMEESKAYDAELTYRDSQLDSTQTTYALVHVKDGNAVLKDVLIDGVSIQELVKMGQNQNKQE
ncbi:MAG: GDYXXLXY domain-containing protein [Bacteroidota bacterium]